MRPAVSIIVLVYGVEKYIERCARALFGQTMDDLEYIIVDDCTQDRSMDILFRVLEEYPQRKGQVKVIHNEVNRGQAYSRRVGVEAATGEYIIHCDSDDWPELEMYAKLYAKATEGNLDIVLCRKSVHCMGKIDRETSTMEPDDLLASLIRRETYCQLFNKLVSRKAYEKGIVYPRTNIAEDLVILTQLVYNSDSFGYIHEPLYNYVIWEGSISQTKNSVEKTEQIRENFDILLSFLEAEGLSQKYKKDIVDLKCQLKSSVEDLPTDYYVNLYPEVNLALLFNKRFTIKERIGHLTHLLGIHGISKLFKRKRV